MPHFLEAKLKKEYPNNPGAVYGTMNKLGYMKGNKETKKGKAAQKKHNLAKRIRGHKDEAHAYAQVLKENKRYG